MDLILDTGGVFGSLPPLALPRVISGDAGVVPTPPAPKPCTPPPSGESNSSPSPNASLLRVDVGVVSKCPPASVSSTTLRRVGCFFLGAAGGSIGMSSRPGRTGWVIGGVDDMAPRLCRLG